MTSDSVAQAGLVDDLSLVRIVMEQSDQAVIITDTTPTIQYANAAAARMTGFAVEEMIGQNPRIFQSGVQDAAFFEAMWSTLEAGQAWSGVFVNRHRNGEVYEERASITPVFDRDGVLIAYASTKRARSRERRREADAPRWLSERGTMVQLMSNVQPGESVQGTAAAFCAAATELDGIDLAMVLLLQADGTLTAAGVDVPGFEFERLSPTDSAAAVVATTTAGPWCRALSDPTGPAAIHDEGLELLRQAGMTAIGYAAVPWEKELAGVLVVATKAEGGVEWIRSRLGAIEELGFFATSVLGRQAYEYTRMREMRAGVIDVLENSRFYPVFQPVINTQTGEIAGYEALTRFDDGIRPDFHVADAHAVGLGSRFESELAAAAVAAARHLPSDLWLGLNFSASAILDGSAAQVVVKANRAVVIEITEHAPIESYPAVRRAITQGGDVLLSVDDAGAGFASLRHVLELDPDIVKLDIALVRGIDTDPARQALVAGMRHFGLKTGTTLIAEGVETRAEAQTIMELGVELAQGYLFGLPAPL